MWIWSGFTCPVTALIKHSLFVASRFFFVSPNVTCKQGNRTENLSRLSFCADRAELSAASPERVPHSPYV